MKLGLVGAAVTTVLAAALFAAALAGDSYAQAAAPVNTVPPSISGTPANGSRLQANRGTWTGTGTITYAYQWLRCNAQGEACGGIADATTDAYTATGADVGRTLRVRVTARNNQGATMARSNATSVVQQGNVESVPASSVPRDERLVVANIIFSPNPVTSRNQVITAQVRVRDTRGLLVRDARVFMRATPRVTSGDTKVTGNDGWATLQFVPNRQFRIRTGYNVQFFIQAYREGDPALAGIQGSRLVQVRTRSA
jgi:opacity protein-like surface antigen